jgi:hypothetical protein
MGVNKNHRLLTGRLTSDSELPNILQLRSITAQNMEMILGKGESTWKILELVARLVFILRTSK